MTTAELKRENVIDITEQEDTFADQAHQVLGYTVLKKQTRSKSVADCFKKVSIRPFDPESVEKYKEQAIRDITEPQFKKGVILTLAISVIWFSYPIFLTIYHSDPIYIANFGLSIILMSITAMFCIPSVQYHWEKKYLKDYKKEVPKYALNLAIDLQKELSSAGIAAIFYVDELVVNERVDPFLVLWTDNDRYEYLEVWDEPKFGAERVV
jgi:hypothetical protein